MSDDARRAIVVLGQPNLNVWKSFRNFPGVTVRAAVDLSALDVVAGGLVIAEQSAMDALAARVGAQTEASEGTA